MNSKQIKSTRRKERQKAKKKLLASNISDSEKSHVSNSFTTAIPPISPEGCSSLINRQITLQKMTFDSSGVALKTVTGKIIREKDQQIWIKLHNNYHNQNNRTVEFLLGGSKEDEDSVLEIGMDELASLYESYTIQ